MSVAGYSGNSSFGWISVTSKSQKQERAGALKFGGSVRPGSGNQWHSKGDVITATHLIEYKYTDNKSYSLKQADLETLRRQAILEDRMALFGISFGGKDNYVVLSEFDYENLLAAFLATMGQTEAAEKIVEGRE